MNDLLNVICEMEEIYTTLLISIKTEMKWNLKCHECM